jgi:hypothetical protein
VHKPNSTSIAELWDNLYATLLRHSLEGFAFGGAWGVEAVALPVLLDLLRICFQQKRFGTTLNILSQPLICWGASKPEMSSEVRGAGIRRFYVVEALDAQDAAHAYLFP